MHKFKHILLFCALSVALCISSSADTHYVWTNSPSPTAPYTSWPTAAHVIQDAVDEAIDGDTVLVTNGVYDVGDMATPGNTLPNRVVLTTDVVLRSVNGASNTVIMGMGPVGTSAVRCVFMSIVPISM